MNFLKNASILITGATGSFGSNMARKLLEYEVGRVVLYSRDELKQLHLKNKLGTDDRLRFFIGDIRDLERLKLALKGVDFVIHAAALKQVDTGEYNPMEFIKTNVMGSQNVIEASMSSGVKKVVALSTDKASSPINLYGATKLTADKLFVAANNYSHAQGTSFSVVRYGNVVGSRGSVIPFFKKLAEEGKDFPITDFRMTRFWLTIDQATDFVNTSLSIMRGGELFVPKIPSMRITDLAKAISKESQMYEVGIRPGEKIHEEMISSEDSRRTINLEDRYVINPLYAEWGYVAPEGTPVDEGFTFRSDTNTRWLTESELRILIDSSANHD